MRGRCLIAAMIALSFLVSPFPSAWAQTPTDEVIAVDAVWASAVNGREPADELQPPAAGGPLTLWVRLHGTETALRRLEQGGLPLRHVWMRKAPGGLSSDTAPVVIDEITLDIAGQDTMKARLRREVEQRGFFDWRTWSTKENLLPGRWYVRLLYADHSPVACIDNGRVIKDCLISFTVGTASRRKP